MRIIRLCLIILLLPSLATASELSVFAASSLSEVLREAVQRYQIHQPNESISLHFAGSQSLATQIELGAPADLFIAANVAVMARLEKNGLVGKSQVLLRNRLIIATESELAPPLSSLKDLARPGLLLVVGNPQVPIGSYTRQLFAALAKEPAYGAELMRKIKKNIVSEENMVKAIMAKLLLGEVDAGIVYQSDLHATNTSRLNSIILPAQYNPQASYPIAQVLGGQTPAADFSAFLFSAEAQQLFVRHGFLAGSLQ